jgi:Bacterial Ig-like domain
VRSSIIALLGSIIAGAGCDDTTTTGGSAGPPEILQVFVRERVPGKDPDGNPVINLLPHLAFGDHPDIPMKSSAHPDGDDRDVTAAVARDGQRIRVVVNELLRGNDLQEVACSDGSWSRVPDGTTFDDVADCSGSDLSRCKGICIGASGPVGILDKNHDGAFDEIRMIDGVVTLMCDGASVPIDPERSYYQPSGNQLIPSSGVEELGPAVAIVPAAGMKPNSTCNVTFASTVVDKKDRQICAPTGGNCTPGDTSAIHFKVEPFLVATGEPADKAMDVPATDENSTDATIKVHLNATLDAATVAASIVVKAGDTPVAGLTPMVSPDDDATIVMTVAGGFQAGTDYTVTIKGGAGGVKDMYADQLAADTTLTWTTE